MTTFAKPTAFKPALKLALYGPAGSGKTFTALLLAEGMARRDGKRIALIDTEQGSAFYGMRVPQRQVHTEPFDFDVLHTRAITDVLNALRNLDVQTHGVVVIDSISHLWDACKNAYVGKTTRHGQIPLHAWSTIKKPYRELMTLVLAIPVHVIVCGRQAIDYGEDGESGELKQVGFRLRAEGETGYEPDVLVRLESHRVSRKQPASVLAHVEKDRTGVLAGRTIEWPTFDTLVAPLLELLGGPAMRILSDEEVGTRDADALARREEEGTQRSKEQAAYYQAKIESASTLAELERIGAELKPSVKATFIEKDLLMVRARFGKRLQVLKAGAAKEAGGNVNDLSPLEGVK